MNIDNKKIIVTGAGSGIGRQIVLALLQHNASIIAIDINKQNLEETKHLAEDAQERVSIYELNIADLNAIQTVTQTILNEHKTVDGIINNAGIIQPFTRVHELEWKDVERVMNVNFYGMLALTQTLLPHLMQRPEACIVNVSSMGGFLPVPGQAVYGASKAAVKLLTEALYAELSNTNVHVTVVFPGATKTNIAQNSGVTTPASANAQSSAIPMTSAENAAATIINGIIKNKPRIFIGKDSRTMDILYRINPVFATKFIAKQMQSLLS